MVVGPSAVGATLKLKLIESQILTLQGDIACAQRINIIPLLPVERSVDDGKY